YFISWAEFQEQLGENEMTAISISDESENSPLPDLGEMPQSDSESPLQFQSLEVFRPIGNRPPEPQIAEAQRKEFFSQIHRWSRQGYAVHVFCNNDGERQRF